MIVSLDCSGREVAESNEETEICIVENKILEKGLKRRRHCYTELKDKKERRSKWSSEMLKPFEILNFFRIVIIPNQLTVDCQHKVCTS